LFWTCKSFFGSSGTVAWANASYDRKI
jgi:hypothetical protein